MFGLHRINEDNFLQALVDWTQATYDDELNKYGGDYPYPSRFDTTGKMVKQTIIWFVLEWKNPRTGTTLLEEFVDKFVKDPELAAQVSQFGCVLYGTFYAIRRVSKHVLVVVDGRTEKEYQVKFRSRLPRSCEDLAFSGYIHPWKDDGAYRATGILTFERLPNNTTQSIAGILENSRMRTLTREAQDESEKVPISANSKLTAYLWRQPLIQVMEVAKFLNVPKGGKRERIAGIRDVLSANGVGILKSLSKKELACLLYVYSSPQKAVKHRDLERRFGKDDFRLSLFERGAQSAMGRLREKGLLIVGRKEMQNEQHKVAVVPAEIRDALGELAPSHPQNESAPKKQGWLSRFRS